MSIAGCRAVSNQEYEIEYAESARFGELLAIQTWLDPISQAGQEFTRLQQIKRGDLLLALALSTK